MEKISFQLADFDAPLDLVLHLISKHKLSIMDIDISSLLIQYIDIIGQWQQQNLEVASEFLEMASRLVYMKTVGLLPKHEEESEKLRKDFEGQLMEYSICKRAAEVLSQNNQFCDLFVRQPAEFDFDPTYRLVHKPDLLYQALVDAMGKEIRRRPPSQKHFEALVSRPFVSVSSKIFSILRKLRENSETVFKDLFDGDDDKSSLVATFLAVLELIKSGRVMISHDRIQISA